MGRHVVARLLDLTDVEGLALDGVTVERFSNAPGTLWQSPPPGVELSIIPTISRC